MKVLVIEDDFSIVKMIRAAVKQHGIEISHATSLVQAIEFCSEQTPDLVWTDIGISRDETGTEIFNHLRESVPAVVCTGYEKTALGFRRYWKYVQKGQMAGYGFASIMMRVFFASTFLRSILRGESCGEMGRYSADELNKNIDEIQRGKIERMFALETECLDAWLSNDRARAESIARGLLDGSLC